MIRFLEGTSDDGLGIPYPCCEDANGQNIGYIDLKTSPSSIDLVYELDDWPELKSLVIGINDEQSFFRTLRCDAWFVSVTGHAAFKKLAVGYITIAFEILECNLSQDDFNQLRKRFMRFAPQVTELPETTIHFKHIPKSYNDHGINRAWSEDIEIHGFGRSEHEAKEAFLGGLLPVGEFLLKECMSYPRELKKGRTTIS